MSESRTTNLAEQSRRRTDLDWLRVMAVLLLVPFHAALVFNLNPDSIVYVKDSFQNNLLVQAAWFINLWHMPLLFAIAGAASWYALEKRSPGSYIGERASRLLVPALFGMVALVPLMINIHWLGQSGAPSAGQVYSRFFTVNAADLTGVGGNFTPAHLWFILFLFIFSAAALPIFRLLRKDGGKTIAKLGAFPGAAYLFFLPMALAAATDFLGDKNPVYYFLTFVAGYLIAANPELQESIDRRMGVSIILAAAATAISIPLRNASPAPWSAAWLTGNMLFQFSRWAWVLAILGAGHRFLTRGNRALDYANEAAFPFYILHLPVLTLVSWYVIRLNAGAAVKYPIIVVITIALSLAIYDLLVKRTPVFRRLFGMKTAVPATART